MINTQRVQALIERPALVTAEDRDGLRGLVDRYPHSPGLAMLLARASQLAGHLDQQRDLLRAAAMLENREALFDLLIRPEILKEARHVFEATMVPQESTEEQAVPAPLEAAVEPQPEEGSDASDLAETGAMEREVLLTAIESTIELEVSEWGEEQRTARKPDPAPTEPELPSPEKKTSPSESYADWLRRRAQAVSFGEVASTSSEEEQEPTEGKKEAPQDASVLIDKFLEARPKIGPIRDVDRSVEDLAKQSVLEDRTLVTETMARVFAKQGQIGRAKRIYQELALKYPAKSTYFAAQLKKLGKGG